MDRIEIREKLRVVGGKYKYALLVVLVGLVLMWLPESKAEEPAELPTLTEPSEDTASELEQILGHIDGVGKVKVMLTLARGEEIFYQTDDDHNATSETDSLRTDTVIITDGSRGQSGLIRQINPPIFQGAIVVCQGADRPSVCLAVVEAVSDVTGLGADRISVLKMK